MNRCRSTYLKRTPLLKPRVVQSSLRARRRMLATVSRPVCLTKSELIEQYSQLTSNEEGEHILSRVSDAVYIAIYKKAHRSHKSQRFSLGVSCACACNASQ